MLKKRTVKKTTFELLKKIMEDVFFSDYFLVGGTAAALQLGHRISIDLDLFTKNDINLDDTQNYLKENYNFEKLFHSKNTIKGNINNVFVDFIKYDYPFIKPLVEEDNVRLLSLEDITCMKLSAITDNGSRLKDFVDIAYLSTKFSLNQMLYFYKEKYKEDNLLTPIKALLYQEDIDFNNEPVQLFNAKFSWEKISKRIKKMAENPDYIFKSFPILQKDISIER